MYIFNRYGVAALCLAWCLFNISQLQKLMNEKLFLDLPSGLEFPAYWFITAFTLAPFVIGAMEFDKIGKSLTVGDSLFMTLAKLSPLIFVYFFVIIYIWYPKSGRLSEALVYSLENPNWMKFSINLVVIFFILSRTAIQPYKYVTTALLGVLTAQHLIQLYFWHRLDNGCRTDYDAYFECDGSYIQHKDVISEEITSLGLTLESLFAADLLVTMIYSLIIYVLFSMIKVKIYR